VWSTTTLDLVFTNREYVIPKGPATYSMKFSLDIIAMERKGWIIDLGMFDTTNDEGNLHHWMLN